MCVDSVPSLHSRLDRYELTFVILADIQADGVRENYELDLDQAMQLFKRFPNRIITYKEIVAALETVVPTALEKSPSPNSASPQIGWPAEIVQAGFRAEYRESDLIVQPNLALLRSWAVQWSDKKHKAPFTSVVGPTMIGKTRLLMEFAKHICVVYICLRPPESTGQPPRSPLADTMLPLDPKPDMYRYYSCFLAAILEVVAAFFSRDELKALKSGEQLALWNSYSFKTDNKHNVDDFSSAVQKRMKTLLDEPTKSIKYISKAAAHMNESIKFIESGQLKLLLAVDEAKALAHLEDKSLGISYFEVFCRVLSQIPSLHGFFAAFADTKLQADASFSPSLDRDPSLRLPDFGHELFPPLYKIATLDLMARPVPKSWKELMSPLRLFSYGTPFYGLFFEGALEAMPGAAIQNTLLIAQGKLLCKPTVPSPQELSESQIFALLGSTIHARHTSSDLNSELVSNHAAHCVYISPSRDIVVSQYPPQFVYASAANAFLASNDENLIACIDALAIAMQNGFICLGDSGELATKIILLRAMHKTKKISCDGETSIPYGYSVRLEDFLQTLTGKNPNELNFGPIADDDKKILLQRGRILFNHFAAVNYTPDAVDFLELLYRGLAVQCKRGQAGLDNLFTIYLAPESRSPDSDPLELTNITFCGIRTENQQASIDWTDSHKWSQSGAEIQGINNPYLILLFSLRWKGEEQPPEWNKPTSDNDRRRAYYQFFGLEDLACLTPAIRVALNRLLNAMPEDILKLHEPDSREVQGINTIKWAKRVSPMFHKREDRVKVYPSEAPTLVRSGHQTTKLLPRQNVMIQHR
ncbi:hypothetical protein MJO28_010932 [Puccinia striiformis f. sp. tritici]|uniref:Uncharacterized protein n=1 Tax=Puccinia striiformis f. sp. tritici TaxID=168172 RepID=A0ACC0E6I0_9BASI|nr:hypothetical protein MJO28_010932 [Puccinia striiformis f. sp. tritici]